MALVYTPVTYTGSHVSNNAAYTYGRTIELDHAGNRLFKWVFKDRTTIASGNPIYDFYHQPGGALGYGYPQPTEYYASGELVVFSMDTKTEIARWSLPGLWSYIYSKSLNSQATTEWNAYLTSFTTGPYSGALVYDIGPNWEDLSQFSPDPFNGMTILEGSDWAVVRLHMFNQVVNSLHADVYGTYYPASYWNGYIDQAFNSNSVRYIAINVTTGEWVPYQLPLLDGWHPGFGIVRVSPTKYAFVSASNALSTTTNSRLVSHVFDTNTKTWSRPTQYNFSTAFIDTRDQYYSEWTCAAANGDSGGVLFATHRNFDYDTLFYRKSDLVSIELNSSGQVTNYTLLNTIDTGTVDSNIRALYYVPADETIVAVRENYWTAPTPGIVWLKYDTTTGALVSSASPTDSYGDTFFATTPWGTNFYRSHKMGYDSKTTGSRVPAQVGSYNEGTHLYPYFMDLETLTATPWTRFVPYWTALDDWGYWVDLRWFSFDESRQGIWVDYNPDPAGTDPYPISYWTFVSAPTPSPTMGLCFLEETDTAYKDFQVRYPD